ncbi:MAG: aspartate--tRNA ligase [Gemmatimonadetes bacterium]|nr:aspartate--tRNA ligase [Gemmatimonadota bacterium]
MFFRIVAWAPPLLWMGFLFFLSGLEIESGLLFPGLDKLVHVVLYAVLGVSLAWSRWRTASTIPGYQLVLVGVVYGYLDEWHQSFVPGRFPSWEDGLADVIGLTIGFYFFNKCFSGPQMWRENSEVTKEVGEMDSSKSIEKQRTGFRSQMVGGLCATDKGREVQLVGWVHRRRDLGSMVFLDIRDRTGLIQVSLGPDWTDETSLQLAHELGAEDVVSVKGLVSLRPNEMKNVDMKTGEIEIQAVKLGRFSRADTPVIPVFQSSQDELPSEELRLQHRVLDLRRRDLQSNLSLRHRLALECRNYMDDLGFIEIETPILTKPTPEGARDYLVPSRIHHGEFYALPQSPQIYKQLCMAAGFDRYFQIARCFRDEDLRADRQPEFTQIDIEASFVTPDDIMKWVEGLMVALASHFKDVEARIPFDIITFADAMERFGTDRPDLRHSVEIQDWTDTLEDCGSNILKSAVIEGGRIRGISVKGGSRLSRKKLDHLQKEVRKTGAAGVLWVKRTSEGESGPLSSHLDDESYGAIGLDQGDLALVAAGPDPVTSLALSTARSFVVQELELEQEKPHAWLWVVDFPIFGMESNGEFVANHHPFVMPVEEDAGFMEENPECVRGLAYDLVYNGVEFGSGSIRNHDPDVQRKILKILGLSDGEIDEKFGFLLKSLASGTPPHGGIALGVDRIVAEFVGADSLRDVIAFPKTTAARGLLEGSPILLQDENLAELGLARLEKTDKSQEVKRDKK